ncbi:MAG TPA: hypothetical protein VK846_02215 [Candidatus Limnocylindria bacterium]|nr:hypothetical protein [Candidatus Limnocylindria bacterium]
MWGSGRDQRLLDRMQESHLSFEKFCADFKLLAHQGFETRPKGKGAEYCEELVGKKKLSFSKLREVGRIFSFPPQALGTISEAEAFIRKRGGLVGLEVSRPPHIVMDASRRFAVFSNEFIAVPPRQVGISGVSGSEDLLRALSLYLSSEFCTYHQFFVSPKWGVDQNLADLDALKKLPVPLENLTKEDAREWNEIHREVVSLSTKRFEPLGRSDAEEQRFTELLAVLNSKVFKVLRIRAADRWLIEDFVHLHLQLNKGKVTQDAMRAPTPGELQTYLSVLRDSLDGFLSANRGVRHKLETVTARESAFISVALQRTSEPVIPRVIPADDTTASALLKIRDRLRQKHSQWLYFDRSLKIYDGKALYQFKPMQRLHWTRRQAVLDADEIIAEAASHSETT